MDNPGPRKREETRRVLRRLRRDALVLARTYELPLRALEAERANVKRRYGVCYDDGSIRIRLRHVRTGELLKYSSLIDTLCHELAHLRHFDHGLRFEALYRNILAYARGHGIYRPALRRDPRREVSGLRVRSSSILPLARLEPRAGATRRRPPTAPAPGAGREEGRSGRREGRRIPEQLDLFR